MTPDEMINFIMPDASKSKRASILALLDVRPSRPSNSGGVEIGSMPKPQIVNPEVRFNYSFDELVEITNQFTPGKPDDLKRVLRYALIWSGMRVDDQLIHWATTDHGYDFQSRLPRVTLPLYDKRLSIRVVPNSWEESCTTTFNLTKGDTGVQILASDRNGKQIEIARPTHRFVTESVQTLAYIKDQRNGTKDVTINPFQRCTQRCEFCCRGYHNMTRERLRELINLSPNEMARYLIVKFPNNDWSEVSGITFVTGDFPNDKVILDYVQGFVESMIRITNGQWNPLTNVNQNIAVSTHLLQSRESMEAAKKIGMKRFIYTAELSDDAQRKAIMYVSKTTKNLAINKGHLAFTRALDVIKRAIDVFGADNVEPVLVIGLDSSDQTIQSLKGLKKLGIKRVSRALFNVYNMNQFALIRSSFEDAVAGMLYARDLFDSAHSRVFRVDNSSTEISELFS